jgi:putative cardiolipin synthase
MYWRFHAGLKPLSRQFAPPKLSRRLILLAALVLAGCASVPFDYPKTESYSRAPDPNTVMGDALSQWQQENGEESGFISLTSGMDALGARLRMMAAAQNTIDAQYFILKNDRAGALFVGKMLLAADRGVKVRLLIDDIFSPGIDRQLTLLDSHPNIEVRMFNPVSRNSLRYWAYLLDFGRTNRRMHNKSFTVDGSMSIVGGRNIGEEYFELTQDVLFDDYEVFVLGPVVKEIGAGFDEFWNSQLAVPVAAFRARIDPAELERWRQLMREEADAGAKSIYSQAVNSTMLRDIREQRITPVPAEAILITDSPDKLLNEVGNQELAVLAQEKARRFAAAQQEVVIVTPYFIPQKEGRELIKGLIARGVRVVIITNSLASTNHVAVHGHYARHRKKLLQAGAEIY